MLPERVQSVLGPGGCQKNEGLTDVGKLSILKDEEIVLFAQRGQEIDDRWLKIIEYIDVCLDRQIRPRIRAWVWDHSP